MENCGERVMIWWWVLRREVTSTGNPSWSKGERSDSDDGEMIFGGEIEFEDGDEDRGG